LATLRKGHDLMTALIGADPAYPRWQQGLRYFDQQLAALGPLARDTAKQ
jgi:hypothetical protein